MRTAGKDGTKSCLLILSPKTLFLTLKSHPSPWQEDVEPLSNPFVNTTLSLRIIIRIGVHVASASASKTTLTQTASASA